MCVCMCVERGKSACVCVCVWGGRRGGGEFKVQICECDIPIMKIMVSLPPHLWTLQGQHNIPQAYQHTHNGTTELPQSPDTAPTVTFVTTSNWHANWVSIHGSDIATYNRYPHPTLVGVNNSHRVARWLHNGGHSPPTQKRCIVKWLLSSVVRRLFITCIMGTIPHTSRWNNDCGVAR